MAAEPASDPGDQTHGGNESSRFFKRIRENADRIAVLGPAVAARRHQQCGVTQAEVAAALRARGLSVSLGWWQKLEAGSAKWTEPLVAAYSALLQLPAAEDSILHTLTLGYEPRVRKAIRDAATANQAHLDAVPYDPVYVEDDAWQVRQGNAVWADWFPALKPGTNVMVWCLTDPLARRQLVDWETSWGSPMLAQLRTALYKSERDLELRTRLQAMIDTCRRGSPDVQRLWEQDAARFHLGAMGDVRRLDLPQTGLITVRLWAAEPIGSLGWRMIGLHRMGEDERDGC
jgi:hypothetical protein